MAYELKDNRWSLFKNTRKEKETSPEYSGTININGKVYKLNAWIESGATGKYFTGTVYDPDEKAPI